MKCDVYICKELSHVVCQVPRPCSEVLWSASLRLCVYFSARCWTQEDPFIESVPDVDSRRSALNGVVLTVNASVAKFASAACTCKSEHWLYPVSGSHFSVSLGEYKRFMFDWEITSIFRKRSLELSFLTEDFQPHGIIRYNSVNTFRSVDDRFSSAGV